MCWWVCVCKFRSCCCSVARSLDLTLCDPMNWSTPVFPVLHYLPEFAQTHVHWVGDAIQPSHFLSPLLLLPLIFPSLWVFSSELLLCNRWPKYWSFSFNISLGVRSRNIKGSRTKISKSERKTLSRKKEEIPRLDSVTGKIQREKTKTSKEVVQKTH